MDFIAPLTISVTLFLVIGAVARHLIVNRRMREIARINAELQGKLLDKLDNTQMGQLATDFGLLPEHGDTKARPRHDDAIAWDDVAGGMPRVAPWHPSRE